MSVRWILRPSVVVCVLLALSLVLNANFLRGGFQLDDFFFLNMMRQNPSPHSWLLGFWAVDEAPGLSDAWWFEGESIGAFWRPLPSWVIGGFVRVFGEQALPLHLLSLILHGLVAGTLFLLVRKLTGRAFVALLSGIIFLACEDHSMGVGWIATITDMLCVLFANLAFLAHTYWLERRRAWLLCAMLLALGLSLLSKESGVVAPVVIALMSLLMPDGRNEPTERGFTAAFRTGRFARRWLSWLPALLMLVVYLVTYKLLGFGGMNNSMYTDPLTNPVGYLAHLVSHLPIMWLATLSSVPPSVVWFAPELHLPLAALGVVLFGLWLAALWYLRWQPLVLWAMGLYLLALLPQLGADASERALYFPYVGAAVLLALLIERIGLIARRVFAESAVRAPLFTRCGGWVALVGVLIPGLILTPAMSFVLLPSLEKPTRQIATMVPHIRQGAPERVFVLNTPGFMHAFYPPVIVMYLLEQTIDVRVLCSMNGVVSVERVGERSFVVHADRTGWLTNVFAGMLRSPGALTVGRTYEQEGLRVTLQKVSRGDVRAARFELDRPLHDPRQMFMQWDGKTFRPLDLSALPIGERVELADTSDLWGSM